MTPEQEEHLLSIKSKFVTLVDSKYRKGQAEHGGDLIDKTLGELVDLAIDEAIDQVVYLTTIKQKLVDAQ